MRPGLSTDLQLIEDTRKTAVIDRELGRLGVDIAALQETRIHSTGSLRESQYTFYWCGREEGEAALHGVGFAVRNSLVRCIERPSGGTPRLLKLRLNTNTGLATIICAYAPTLTSTAEEKDAFYESLNAAVSSVPESEQLFVLGDLNARVGADQESWPECLGLFGVGKLNENGQRLLELCAYHGLCVTNTYFSVKKRHRVSWCHPRSKHWHQLDLVITRRSSLSCISVTRAYHSADCDTDHSMVGSTVRLAPRATHRNKSSRRPRLDLAKTKLPSLRDQYLTSVEECHQRRLDPVGVDETWSSLRDVLYEPAVEVFGKTTWRDPDWFVAYADRMQPVLEEKRMHS